MHVTAWFAGKCLQSGAADSNSVELCCGSRLMLAWRPALSRMVCEIHPCPVVREVRRCVKSLRLSQKGCLVGAECPFVHQPVLSRVAPRGEHYDLTVRADGRINCFHPSEGSV